MTKPKGYRATLQQNPSRLWATWWPCSGNHPIKVQATRWPLRRTPLCSSPLLHGRLAKSMASGGVSVLAGRVYGSGLCVVRRARRAVGYSWTRARPASTTAPLTATLLPCWVCPEASRLPNQRSAICPSSWQIWCLHRCCAATHHVAALATCQTSSPSKHEHMMLMRMEPPAFSAPIKF